MDSLTGILLLFVILLLGVCIAFVVLSCIANWKLLEKAGEPGWSALIPFYNSFQIAKVATGDTKICWAYLALSIADTLVNDLPKRLSDSDEASGGVIGLLISLAVFVFGAYIMVMFAKSFGQSTGICILSVFIGGLAFGFKKDAEYIGPKGERRFGGYNSYNNDFGGNEYNNSYDYSSYHNNNNDGFLK